MEGESIQGSFTEHFQITSDPRQGARHERDVGVWEHERVVGCAGCDEDMQDT